ncbi:MAG TPA: xanthine dehydrogenase family protein subunit M [Blastocatellia bacterium]|nr:xanthine dehydrogenase family protein subunit M [Blastocatellia bacterium]
MRAYLPDYDLRVPATLGEALTLLAQEPGVWKPFAGGTDLMVLLEAGKLEQTKFISLWGLTELRGITTSDDEIIVGALTTYTELQNNPVLQSEFPLLCQAAGLTGSVAIQNRGTLGGNIANASPAADSLPALLVYEASLELISTSGTRIVPYPGFHTGYKKSVMKADEIIRAIRLPRTTAGWFQASRKVGTRRAQAISKVCLAAMAQVENSFIRDIRLACGSVAPVPLRCVRTEAALKSQPIDETVISAARTELANELRPIDDLRSTAEYRLRVAGNLLEEFLWKAAGER